MMKIHQNCCNDTNHPLLVFCFLLIHTYTCALEIPGRRKSLVQKDDLPRVTLRFYLNLKTELGKPLCQQLAGNTLVMLFRHECSSFESFN